MEYNYKKVETNLIDWEQIEQSSDSTIYKTQSWFLYLKKWKNIEPCVIEVYQDKDLIGFFVGEIVHKVFNILGSPFEGIGTAHQGLSMLKDVAIEERIEIYRQLAKWVFKQRIAVLVQVEDWSFAMEDFNDKDIHCEPHDGYLIDLSLTEEELFHNLHQKSCRYSINKAQKSGVVIRETTDPKKFVEIYYDQLIEVFAKQGLKPTYDKDCVQALVDALYPQRMLLLEAITPEGEIAATGLFPGEKNLAVFWGGASYQKFQKLCPNEPLIWEAIKMWKQRGTKTFDLCGVRQYKLKFGPVIYTKPRIIFAKYSFLIFAKQKAKQLYYGFRNFMARFKK